MAYCAELYKTRDKATVGECALCSRWRDSATDSWRTLTDSAAYHTNRLLGDVFWAQWDAPARAEVITETVTSKYIHELQGTDLAMRNKTDNSRKTEAIQSDDLKKP